MQLPEHIVTLLHLLESNGFQSFVVGGCVRNVLLGLSPDDWDICTQATPEEMFSVFREFTVIPTGIKHGTVTVLCQDGQAEITTFRTDGAYADSRHPKSVSFVSTIEEDLARRDFTVNAMAYHPKRGLVDPYGGQKDLKSKRLRCVGEPDFRFQEDALRILRALRFASVYSLDIEEATSSAMHKNKEGLQKIARERIYSELTKTLTSKSPGKILSQYPDILSVIFQTDYSFTDALTALDSLPATVSLRLAALLQPLDGAALNSLKPDNHTKKQVRFLLANTELSLPATLTETRQLIREHGLKQVSLLFAFKGENPRFIHEILDKNLCCSLKELALSGKDLLAAGVPEGEKIAAYLSQALDAVIQGIVPNEKKALLNYLFL